MIKVNSELRYFGSRAMLHDDMSVPNVVSKLKTWNVFFCLVNFLGHGRRGVSSMFPTLYWIAYYSQIAYDH